MECTDRLFSSWSTFYARTSIQSNANNKSKRKKDTTSISINDVPVFFRLCVSLATFCFVLFCFCKCLSIECANILVKTFFLSFTYSIVFCSHCNWIKGRQQRASCSPHVSHGLNEEHRSGKYEEKKTQQNTVKYKECVQKNKIAAKIQNENVDLARKCWSRSL